MTGKIIGRVQYAGEWEGERKGGKVEGEWREHEEELVAFVSL